MNIYEYNEFKSDVKRFFKKSILFYDLNITDVYNGLDKPIQNYVFLRNKYCVICLNNLESFPYPDVTPHFYFYNKVGELFKLEDSLIITFLEINKNDFDSYCIQYNNKFSGKDIFLNNEKGGYWYGIKSINDLILKFYSKIFNGKLTKDDYDKFLKKVIT